jgi:hypothetical protein
MVRTSATFTADMMASGGSDTVLRVKAEFSEHKD